MLRSGWETVGTGQIHDWPVSGTFLSAQMAAVVRPETPHQTRRYLLTDGGKRANLLGSMCARVKDASQRPVTFACGG